MGPYEGERFFYLHIMKTAGSTFRNYLRSNFPSARVYPRPGIDHDMEQATYDIDYLLSRSATRHRSIAVYTGHFPSIVADLLDVDLVTMTLLRDPVERTISYLRHCREHQPQHHDRTLDQIYDDDFYHRGFILNHQTKQFCFTRSDPLTTYFQHIDVDAERLDQAKENLGRVDVVGLTEEFPAFIDEIRRRFGWGPLEQSQVHVGADTSRVPPGLRDRIEDDNRIDRDFYNYALSLVPAEGTSPRS